MPVPMIVVDVDSLLVERKEDTRCSIHHIPTPDADGAQKSTDDTSAQPTVRQCAFALSGGGPAVGAGQVTDWLTHMNVTNIDTDLMVDICDELLISQLTAVCILSDKNGFLIHSVSRQPGGVWSRNTISGQPDEYAVITSRGEICVSARTVNTATPDQHAVVSYATYARHNDELSNHFDHYVVMSDEIIENAHI